MNRKERRATSKRLGISKYQKTLPRDKKLNLMRENIIAGKQKENEMKETVRIQQSEDNEQKESEIIYNMAEKISVQKQIPLIDAMVEAQIKFDKSK